VVDVDAICYSLSSRSLLSVSLRLLAMKMGLHRRNLNTVML
jgi:hypothetical protein